MEPTRFALVRNNVVFDVVMWDLTDQELFASLDPDVIAVANDWACPGDWYEAVELRFYRQIP